MTPGGTTCICCTTGYCEIAGTASSNDGTGKIQYRIVNVSNLFTFWSFVAQLMKLSFKNGKTPAQPSGTSNQITSPASTGMKLGWSSDFFDQQTCTKYLVS